ncbi:hypothetical protein BS47DRAFT_1369751 [Hydnum rufescens UP504]|uniref:Uncharacterized protein n=1 Tax=Hydnum rufescens UP504 TaxID=1448309 RepID=A0A9P6ACE9_9AGAM|nr:hypothetical protein BS47DRAFT_1369751 [Hydnum rufescens UP504]
MAVLQSTNTRLLPGLSDISSPELFFPSYVSTLGLVSSAELGSCDTTGAPPHHTKPRSRSLVSNSDNTLNTRQPINRVTMPRERPVLGIQSMPLNPSSDTFIDALVLHETWTCTTQIGITCSLAPYDPIGITWGMVPYDPDWYYMGLGPVRPRLIIGINMCELSHLSAEMVLTPSHLFAETVLGASHLLTETVFSASHLFAETVFSASHLFVEMVLSVSPLFAETYQ